VLVRAEAEVLDGLTRVLRSTEEEDVRASRGAERKLVKCDGLTTGLLDAGTGGCGESQGGDGQLGDLVEAVVIGDGADDRADLALR
jgi:hypothetical protein